MKTMTAPLLALAVALSGGTAVAHHGWASYSDQDSQVSGVLETARLGAPHGMLKVRTPQGVWTVMLAPPAAIVRAGLTVSALPKGAQVIARGHKRVDGTLEIKTERLTVGTRTYDLYPNRV